MNKAYEHLSLMNQGFDQVARSLKSLAKYPALRPDEIAQFAQLAEEARSATNSHLLDLMAIEIARAGRLSGNRNERERKQEQDLERRLNERGNRNEGLKVPRSLDK